MTRWYVRVFISAVETLAFVKLYPEKYPRGQKSAVNKQSYFLGFFINVVKAHFRHFHCIDGSWKCSLKSNNMNEWMNGNMFFLRHRRKLVFIQGVDYHSNTDLSNSLVFSDKKGLETFEEWPPTSGKLTSSLAHDYTKAWPGCSPFTMLRMSANTGPLEGASGTYMVYSPIFVFRGFSFSTGWYSNKSSKVIIPPKSLIEVSVDCS